MDRLVLFMLVAQHYVANLNAFSPSFLHSFLQKRVTCSESSFCLEQSRARSTSIKARKNQQEELTGVEKDLIYDHDRNENDSKDNDDDNDDSNNRKPLPLGIPKHFKVVKQYPLPSFLDDCTFDDFVEYLSSNIQGVPFRDIERLNLRPQNLTLPIALMLACPDEFPTQSRARKACRKGNIIVHRRNGTEIAEPFSNLDECFKGIVKNRIYPSTDIIGKQVRMGKGYFPILNYQRPPFPLPVVYEDDYFALVNKPAGIVVYGTGRGREFRMSIRAALPFVLTPPSKGTYAVLRRPASVHRLDKPTSGLLVITKTKPAMVALTQQFHDRVAKKTYMAIINGLPQEFDSVRISSKQAYEMGVNVDPEKEDEYWQLIDSPLEERQAITIWRPVQYAKSLHANDGYLTLVEVKLKTGRHHQIRRHFAWNCDRPLVGDTEYDGGTPEAKKFRERGLFLCSNQITLQHPHYNTPEGRDMWNQLSDEEKKAFPNAKLWMDKENDKVMITATVELPEKFKSLLAHEEERYTKFINNEPELQTQ